jgi:hypothetical protein
MKSWNYKNDLVNGITLQTDWNQTLKGMFNEIKGGVIDKNDVISASYILKELIESLIWLNKPKIEYRYDNQHSIFVNNIKMRVENYIYNHQENEEWIISQKNVFNNLDSMVEGMYPEIWKNKESIRNYINRKFSSGKIINNDDTIYVGIIHNFITNQNNLLYFNIEELKDINNNLYEYFKNENNYGLLPRLTFKTAWKIKSKFNDLPIKLSRIGYRIKKELNGNIDKFIIVIPNNMKLNNINIHKEFNSEIEIVLNKDVTVKGTIFIYSNNLTLDDYNYRLCGKIELCD